jgi:biopolymer transport protein ExbB/TolQ
MDISTITWLAGDVIYVAQAVIAIWGAFCVIIVWRRVTSTRFRTEEEQDAFLGRLEERLDNGDFEGTAALCDGDERAMPQLALLAVANRRLGYAKVRTLVADRFQRDVLADLEYRLSWVYTVIKLAPMLGLFGTVVGMTGAFKDLARSDPNLGGAATANSPAAAGQSGSPAVTEASTLAENISLALLTTVYGLATAIPLVFCTASINVRIRKLEDLVGAGLTRFLESFKVALARMPAGGT